MTFSCRHFGIVCTPLRHFSAAVHARAVILTVFNFQCVSFALLVLKPEYSGKNRSVWWLLMPWLPALPRPWFNIKMPSYQYRKSHSGDKTAVLSYLHYGISFTGKMASLYWISPQGTSRNDIDFAVKLVFVVCGKWFQLPTHLQWQELIEIY